MQKTVAVIGGGISGLSAACYLARDGHSVEIYEKNDTIGGRCRTYTEDGFVFDMGPSWYWMPDIFERFYNDFGKTTSDFYELKKLNPGFQIYYSHDEKLQVPADLKELYSLFDEIESGSSWKLKKYLAEAELKYETGMRQLAYMPSLSLLEFAHPGVLKSIGSTDMFKSMSNYVRKYFRDKRLISLMEFPVLFLGAMPDKIPALYSLMNHAALTQGTYYPMGGMYKLVEAMKSIAEGLGVKIHTNAAIQKIEVEDNIVKGVVTRDGYSETDSVISATDYYHTEQMLLEEPYRNYNEKYWNSRVMAPSCLIFYVGINKKLKSLIHHNLFFDTDFDTHAREIYQQPNWPSNPMFYVCAPSQTDASVAPAGMENLFMLIPIAAGMNDNTAIHDEYFRMLIKRIEKLTDESILPHIIYKKSYCINDFIKDYNAYKGNAYGLANTLRQTAILKPRIRNSKIKNLFYAGQLTVPGPGVPPSLISGKIAAEQVTRQFKKQSYYESAF